MNKTTCASLIVLVILFVLNKASTEGDECTRSSDCTGNSCCVFDGNRDKVCVQTAEIGSTCSNRPLNEYIPISLLINNPNAIRSCPEGFECKSKGILRGTCQCLETPFEFPTEPPTIQED